MQLETIILKSGTASFCPTALTGRPLLELAHFFSRKQPPGTEPSYLDQNVRKFCQSGKLSIGRCKTDRTRRFYLRSPKRQLKQTALAVKITRSDIETSKVWTINRGYEIFVTKNFKFLLPMSEY